MPIFTHDCEKCLYCGETAMHPHNRADVYVCHSILFNEDTVIVRYSDEGNDYYSVPYKYIDIMPKYEGIKEMVDKVRQPG